MIIRVIWAKQLNEQHTCTGHVLEVVETNGKS